MTMRNAEECIPMRAESPDGVGDWLWLDGLDLPLEGGHGVRFYTAVREARLGLVMVSGSVRCLHARHLAFRQCGIVIFDA